ncbi:hypothetical protein OBBRIDRAFT_260534 [Obba rivulosa]|uniref:Uncharacterized protein n=1 Tax=Obba rivulosa TaxID=1052685 RepID=A0A8E2DFL9_9APHY|nr:hypothetical protein OBBRIDRAFT_260534 [Obba rivulosa]
MDKRHHHICGTTPWKQTKMTRCYHILTARVPWIVMLCALGTNASTPALDVRFSVRKTHSYQRSFRGLSFEHLRIVRIDPVMLVGVLGTSSNFFPRRSCVILHGLVCCSNGHTCIWFIAFSGAAPLITEAFLYRRSAAYSHLSIRRSTPIVDIHLPRDDCSGRTTAYVAQICFSCGMCLSGTETPSYQSC